ncbi:hypothetical protein LY56_02459 [Roseinatronobacter thiooxidans]|uniref:Uncharacterized protein n=3 Tax=Roseinatronobacter thiooxidans TaxID=121821 RepID=A0A2W7Q0S7_9RHOB|nr:hypothetical protein LY56_02459 [Roseinatronobacter thiooxidans]
MGNIVSKQRQSLPQWLRRGQTIESGTTSNMAQRRGSRISMLQVAQLLLRGFLVAFVFLCPALLLPEISQDVAQGVTFLAILAAIVVMTEYSAAYPGLIEFRDAKPYNRARFLLLVVVVLSVTALQREIALYSGAAGIFTSLAIVLGNILSFSFSPVALLVASLPQGLSVEHLAIVKVSAALAYTLSLVGLGVFLIGLMLGYWPRRAEIFNVWVNLPNFDPTKGVDIVQRLERDAQINVVLGIIMPFSLPALLHLSTFLVQPVTLETPLALVWGVSLWAFIPVTLVMRGVAMYRVAQLIRAQRRRVAEAQDAVPLPPQSAYS